MRNYLLIIALLLSAQTIYSQSNVDLTTVTVKEYINLLKVRDSNKPFDVITITNAPADWISDEDLDYLMKFIDSEEPANCVMSIYSSYFPKGKSTLGGQVANIIDAYRQQEVYPNFLTRCNTTDQQRVEEIKEWWLKKERN